MRRTLYGKTWLPGALIVLMVSLSACTTGGSTDPLEQRGISAHAMTGASSGTGQAVSENNSVMSPGVSPVRQGITGAPDSAAETVNASKPGELQASQAQPTAPSSPLQNGVAKHEVGTVSGTPSTDSSTPPASASGASRTDAQGASSSSSATTPAQAASSSASTGTAQPEAPDASVSPPASASQAGTASSPAASATEPATTSPGAAEAPQSPPAQNAPAPASGQDAKSTAVSVRIVGDKEKGTILDTVQVELRDGDTVVDVLKRITKEKKIQLETRGSGKSSYIEGIANLYEFDKGAKSGWLYRVNGKFPSVSAGAYTLSKGDSVEWLYTLNLGKDVGKEADK
ncbi:DUF4430 domain-containing protein [Paenibacillus allorhizosphaerae]|uniref:Transcobalamin-like C-terminal domain-containing protein n=1 Tax=Paenibacillus allorhizosphaerae TaxID=2849866 RepID=A0ABM8VRW2_9BACL|nr:DUF4430 domain-containing protein [Paenibacillus allorhizosphaerae]CAG7655799.1 hypothetical protein PAECIP111802_06211 [Paenibacillus allorhizosphaerae]